MVRVSRLLVPLLVLLAPALAAQVQFSGLDLSRNNRLLFTAEVELPVHGSYDTLMLADLSDRALTQLTFFPEEITYLEEADRLQIQNRFGVFRSTRELDGFSPVGQFEAFTTGGDIATGRLSTIQASPNGRFMVYLRRKSPAFAELVLLDLDSEEETVVSRELPMSLSGPAVTWSEGSDYFVYEKHGQLYYFSIEQLEDDRVLDESFRDIGEGSFRSVRWGSQGDLYYVSGSLVYRIQQADFFARSFYQDLVKSGSVVGKIPFDYEPNFDRFWISPDGREILFSKGGRNVFVYVMRSDDFRSTGEETLNLPYLYLPRNTEVSEALWSERGTITLLAESIEFGVQRSAVYRLTRQTGSRRYEVRRTEDSRVSAVTLSPEGSHAALVRPDEVVIKSYEDWTTEAEISHRGPLHVVWLDDDRVVVAGEKRTELVNWRTGSARLLAMSEPDDYGFTADGEVLARTTGETYRLDQAGRRWTSHGRFPVSERNVATNTFRVYTERETGSTYRNIVMVRKAAGTGTEPLISPPERQYEPFPEESEPVDFEYFTHGSRIRRREVSLVFNAIGSVEGLRQILNTLQAYDIRTTFFLNGDFIERHPGATREIADSGHEIGSLFFTHFDLSDSQYEITESFVRQGLARTEDQYFNITGDELSLMWHAPYYFVNSTLLEASSGMNYTYVGRDVDSLDWIPRNAEPTLARLYRPTAELVERILERKKPGSIISMTVGKPSESIGGTIRDDYLFQYLDLLITRLIERGYEVVPVSTLMEHAR